MTNIKNIDFTDRYEVIAISLINNAKHISRKEAKQVILNRLSALGVNLKGSLTPDIHSNAILSLTDKYLSNIGYSYSKISTGHVFNNNPDTLATDFCSGLKTYNKRERNGKRNTQENYDEMKEAINNGITTLSNELKSNQLQPLKQKNWNGYALDFLPKSRLRPK